MYALKVASVKVIQTNDPVGFVHLCVQERILAGGLWGLNFTVGMNFSLSIVCMITDNTNTHKLT